MRDPDRDLGIGGRVRAARQRRGWSRETLAFHAGISWSAISQLEAGRRRNLWPGTLAALAGALGVTVDYLVSGGAVWTEMLEHRALIYESDDEFLRAGAAFLSVGVDRSEAALAVTTSEHCDLLREHLGGAKCQVEFADQASWCSTPDGALSRIRAFIDGHVDAGINWIRILVEPVIAGRSEFDGRLWATYESLFNLVFRSAPLTALCAYDAAILDADLLEQVHATHSHALGEAGDPVANADYLDPVEFMLSPAAGAEASSTGANR